MAASDAGFCLSSTDSEDQHALPDVCEVGVVTLDVRSTVQSQAQSWQMIDQLKSTLYTPDRQGTGPQVQPQN